MKLTKYIREAFISSVMNEPTKNLPAIANVMADFIVAGWPKGKEALV